MAHNWLWKSEISVFIFAILKVIGTSIEYCEYGTVNVRKMHRQTAQTQIRLLLKKQSDQGLLFSVCYPDKHFVNSIFDQ